MRAAHQPPPGSTRYDQSPWLFLDAANTIFATAKQRVFTSKATNNDLATNSSALPDSFHPILEELPKWNVLAEILEEIEQDAYFNPVVRDDSNGTVLVMCSDQGTCRQLREYMIQMHRKREHPSGNNKIGEYSKPKYSADFMLRKKFKEYLDWRPQFARINAKLFEENQKALESYSQVKAGPLNRAKPPPNKRRRVRGGSSVASQLGRTGNVAVDLENGTASQPLSLLADIQLTEEDVIIEKDATTDNFDDAEDYFELFDPDDLVMIHQYDGDLDEQLLDEVRPRYVIMYEPDAAFIRRVEVYRSSHTDRNVRSYFMYYTGSVEEQRYLSAVRKEKDAFTKLIKERAVRKT